MISRGIIIALLICVHALAGLAFWQSTRAKKAESRAEQAEALVGGYVEAARIRARQDAALEAQRRDAMALDSELQAMEGGDAPLSGYLDAASGRLWP